LIADQFAGHLAAQGDRIAEKRPRELSLFTKLGILPKLQKIGLWRLSAKWRFSGKTAHLLCPWMVASAHGRLPNKRSARLETEPSAR